MISDGLTYEPLEPAHLDEFHKLVQDEHVRRYLMDGNVFPREWSAERIHDSQALFERRGVGLWLVRQKTSNELVGFCGFLVLPSVNPEPQLIYAMFERFSGNGYATEMAQASIGYARENAGFDRIIASVDEINIASVRVLEKLGFQHLSTQQGSFGNMLLLQLTTECS